MLQTGYIDASRAPGPVLMVHGGAWAIPDSALDDHRAGLGEAVRLGRDLLGDGRPALDVVAAVVASMESSGIFDAGFGAVLTDEGTVELDAGIMDGESLAFGSVATMRSCANPILAARRLLDVGDGRVRFLSGAPADRFAQANGVEMVTPKSLIHPRERERFELLKAEAQYHTSHPFLPSPNGTVGCVARDANGHLAAATSTGGTPFRPVGRVGDSPLPGCGFYADRRAAASATGWGEAIASAMLSGRAVLSASAGRRVDGAVQDALQLMGERIQNEDRQAATGGLILIGPDGSAAWGYSTPRMARAGWCSGADPWIEI